MSWLCQGGMEQRSIPLISEYFITLKWCKEKYTKFSQGAEIGINNRKKCYLLYLVFSLYPSYPGM